jgi:hypothetical protein
MGNDGVAPSSLLCGYYSSIAVRSSGAARGFCLGGLLM